MTIDACVNDIPKITINKQLGFIAALPSDIVVDIFEYLTQKDCLTCMTVCHDWDNVIPQYAQEAWTEVKLDTRDIYRNYRRRERCLGNHVKRVVLKASSTISSEEKELCALMQLLLDWGCTEIEHLEISRWHIVGRNTIIAMLKKLAPRLTHLKLTRGQSNIPLLSILSTCPEVTHVTGQHFSFFSSEGLTVKQNRPILTDDLINYHTKIKHLFLDVAMDTEQFERILRSCPDLRCFIGGSQPSDWFPQSSISVDLDLLFTWCPKIALLAAHFSYNKFDREQDPDAYMDDHIGGLRYLNIPDSYALSQVERHLANSQETLEFLSICRLDLANDWSSVFQSLQLPRLHTLGVHHIQFSMHSLVTLINHCPSLVRLDVDCPNLTANSTAILHLGSIYGLRFLRCTFMLDGELSLLELLKRFPALESLSIEGSPLSPRVPDNFICPRHLKHLSLSGVTWNYNGIEETDKETVVAGFLESLICGSKLEVILLSDYARLGYKSMHAIAMVQTLKELRISLDSTVQDNELLNFFQSLADTAIQSLTIYNVNSLSFTLLDTLTRLPLLTVLSIWRIMPDPSFTPVSKLGLQQMLCKSSSLVDIFFSAVTIKDGEETLSSRDQIYDIIHQQIPQPRLSGSERWKGQVYRYLHNKTLFDVSMKRVVN